MRRHALLTVSVLGVVLAACVGPTPFQPAEREGEPGYRVERTEQDHFRIGFWGNSATSSRQVEDSLAWLAAQVTLRNGADWFVIANDKTERTTSYAYFDSYAHSVSQCCHWRGVTWHEYQGTADIVIYRGTPPADDPTAHDAHAIAEELKSRIRYGGRRGTY